jgi:hypothetical protein
MKKTTCTPVFGLQKAETKNHGAPLKNILPARKWNGVEWRKGGDIF